MFRKNHLITLLSVILTAVTITACTRRMPGISTQTPGKVGVIHTVDKGESIWKISRMYSVSNDELVHLNNLKDPSKIKTGERLFIPGSPRILKKNRRHFLKYGRPAKKPDRTTENTHSSSGSSKTRKPPPKKSSKQPEKPGKSSSRKTSAYYSTRLKFAWPLQGSIRSRFGSSKRKQFNGIDIACSAGTPINASEEGEVVYLGEITGYGLTLILAHHDDFYTLYAPVKSPALTLGEIANRGQKMAELEKSPRESSGDGLHFEIRRGKEPLDPMLYLK